MVRGMTDIVKAPPHYKVMDTEAKNIIRKALTDDEFRGYCLGNVLKYRLRAGKKDDAEQDLSKANEYERIYEQFK